MFRWNHAISLTRLSSLAKSNLTLYVHWIYDHNLNISVYKHLCSQQCKTYQGQSWIRTYTPDTYTSIDIRFPVPIKIKWKLHIIYTHGNIKCEDCGNLPSGIWVLTRTHLYDLLSEMSLRFSRKSLLPNSSYWEKNLYVTNRSLLIWQNLVYSFISCEKCVVLGGLPLILVVTFKGLRTEFWPIWNGNWHMLISSSETFVIVSKLDQYQRSAGQLVGSGSHLWLGVIGGTHQRHQDCNQVFISGPVGHQ